MISWAALNRQGRGLKNPPKAKPKRVVPETPRWVALRARLRKRIRRWRRQPDAWLTPPFERMRALLARLERVK